MKLEKTTLSEATQTPKDKQALYVLTYMWILFVKPRKITLWSIESEILNNTEGLRRLQRSPWEREIE